MVEAIGSKEEIQRLMCNVTVLKKNGYCKNSSDKNDKAYCANGDDNEAATLLLSCDGGEEKNWHCI